MQLANVKRATIYFVSRTVADMSLPSADIASGSLVIPLGVIQNALPIIHGTLERNRPVGPEMYQFISGVAEVHALRLKACHPKFNHRLLDDDAVPNVAYHVCKNNDNIMVLDLTKTDPWHYCDMCLARYLFENTYHFFPNLRTLILKGVNLAQPGWWGGLTGLAKALKDKRFPKLQILDLAEVQLNDQNIHVLAPALRAQKDTLLTLEFQGNRLGGFGLKAIMDAMRGSESLERLELDNNELTPGCYERLAVFIKDGFLPAIDTVMPDLNQPGFYSAGRVMNAAIRCARAERCWKRLKDGAAKRGRPLGGGEA